MALNDGLTTQEKFLWDIKQCLKEQCFMDEAASIADVSGGTTYQGYSVAGSATSAAVWRISKTVVSAGVTTRTWAKSSATATDWLLFNKVWDDRASLNYS